MLFVDIIAQSNYTVDYTQVNLHDEASINHRLNFQAVFAILFNGCTGIMGEQWVTGVLHPTCLSVCLPACE